jgi:hypothetical protein
MSTAIFFCDLTSAQIDNEAKPRSVSKKIARPPGDELIEHSVSFMQDKQRTGQVNREKNIQASVDEIKDTQSKELDNLSEDLIACACHIYFADRMIARPKTWFRELEFHIGVHDKKLWESLADQLKKIIGFLTRETIRFFFYDFPGKRLPLSLPQLTGQRNGGVCVFGDNLDAVAGATIVSKTNAIVATFRYGAESPSERVALDRIETLTRPLDCVGFRIIPQGIDVREPTQRTRGFLQLALAAVVAQAISTDKIKEIQVFGNGISSYHLYEMQLCGSGHAVRDTHPVFLNYAQQFFQKLFSVAPDDVKIINQFQYLTPSAILRELKRSFTRKEQAYEFYGKINGCTERNLAKIFNKSHCGCCFSCKVRRLAALSVEFEKRDDHSAYATNPLVSRVKPAFKNKLGPDSYYTERVKSYHENGLPGFKSYIENFMQPDAEIMKLIEIGRQIRDLASESLHFGGERQTTSMQTEIIDLHRRFAQEALPFFEAKQRPAVSRAKKKTAIGKGKRRTIIQNR